MKTKLLPLIILLGLTSIAFTQSATACVMPKDSVYVTVAYDTTDFSDVTLTVGNFDLFGGNPNEWCSCAITSYTNIFTTIEYIAFVDSGTTDPVMGFEPWSSNASAGTQWDLAMSGNWTGFVAEVGSSGLLAGTPVELIVRASLPAGYTYQILDSTVQTSLIGTDEWIDTTSTLSNGHQSIVGMADPGRVTLRSEPQSYFDALDASLGVLSVNEYKRSPAYLNVFPNPATGSIQIFTSAKYSNVEFYNITGNRVAHLPKSPTYDISEFSPGLYFARIIDQEGAVLTTRKFIKQP